MTRFARTLRSQFVLALGAMLLLALAAGAVAVAQLLGMSTRIQQETQQRLAYFNDAQELLEHTRQLQLYASQAQARAGTKEPDGYAAVLRHLDELDRLTARLAVSADTQVLDLHESSQLFRSAVQVVAQLRELPSQEADQARVAQSMSRSVEDMRTYAARMVQAAQQQEASYSREYQASVDALVEASRQTALLIAALVGGSVAAAWAIAHYLLGHRVLGRLRIVSTWLRDRTTVPNRDDDTIKVPVEGQDEIAEMARAVELSARDRQQLARARQSLEEISRRLEAIFENTADAIIVAQAGRIQQMNAAAHRLFGLRADEGVGRPVDELLAGEHLGAGELLGGVAREATAITRNGMPIAVEVTVSEVQTAQGALTIAVLRDATLHIEAQRHLTDARNAAEAARAAQAALLASMNHEMRTPLNGVLGYAQLLAQATNLTQRQREQLRVIQSCGDHLLALVTDALDMARHEAGKAELHLERTDLVQTAHAVADIVNLRAKEAGLQFVLELDEQLPRALLADDRRLRQVLLNLLANAIKFTERGCVTLKVLLQGLHDKTASVRFDVVDTGIGMSREQVDSVFRPFAQFGTAGKRALGTGLGMTISQQLVQLMGGNIEVRSTPGVGSTFSFELQLRVTSVAEVPVND